MEKPFTFDLSKFPGHWTGEDGLTSLVTLQGKRLTWKILAEKPKGQLGGKRQETRGLSQQSRLRMLKFCAGIDWQKATPCVFVTLTVPDGIGLLSGPRMTRARSEFIRRLEREHTGKVPILWRVEYEPRKSGALTGELMSHVHMIVFKTAFIPWRPLRQAWQSVLGWQGYVRTEVKAMFGEKQAGYYLAKYCGKKGNAGLGNCSLVYAAYLRTLPPGRVWGITRKSSLPMCAEHSVRFAPNPDADLIYDHLLGDRKKLNPIGTGSFTILGNCSELALRFFFPELYVQT